MRLAVVVVVSGALMSCGGSPPRAKQVPVVASEQAEAAGERRPYAELSTTVPDGASPGFWLQMPAPLQIWPKLPELLKGGPSLAPFADAQAVARMVLGSEVGSVIDLSQPVDVLLPLPAGDDQRFFWSFRVRSPEAVLHGDAGLTLRRAAAGVWRIGPDAEPDAEVPEEDYEESEDYEAEAGEQPPAPLACQLRHFAQPVGFRVLCAGGAEELERHAPFAAHIAALPVSRADLHAEIGGPPYRALLDGMVKNAREKASEGAGEAERLGTDIANSLLEGFAQNEKLSLDLSLAPDKVLAKLDLAFPAAAGSQPFEAWLGRSADDRLPASFALLPPDNDFALGFGGLGKQTTQLLLKLGLERLMTSLDSSFVVSPKDRVEIAAALGGVVPEDARFSLAVGRDRAAAARVLDSDKLISADRAGKKLPAALASELQATLWGWCVIGVEVAPASYLAAVERLFRSTKLSTPERPGAREQENSRQSSNLRRGGKVAGLPPTTLHIVDDVRPRAKYRPPADGSAPPVLAHDTHYLFVPDGARVWIVLARSEAIAAERARALLRRGQGTGLRGAEPAPTSSIAALAMSVDYLAGGDLDWNNEGQRVVARHILRVTSDFPHGGKTRFPLQVDVVPRQGPGPGAAWHLELRTELPPSTLEELAAWRGLAQ